MSNSASDLTLSEILNPDVWQTWAGQFWIWIQAEAFSLEFAAQLVAILLALFVGFALKHQFNAVIARIFSINGFKPMQTRAVRFLAPVAGPATTWLLLSLLHYGLLQIGDEFYPIKTAANLVGAWAAIRLLSAFIDEPFWARTAASVAWFIAALNIMGWLDPATIFLDGLGFPLGNDDRISVLGVLRTVLVLSLFYWVAHAISKMLTSRIEHLPSLNPSARILLKKTAQIVLMATAGLMALTATGVDLSALAVFGGAVGLGLGFGLQKIFSNLISGILLLMDRSVKPGDVITVDDTYGRVSTLGMRFASVITRDGHEHLIPNEEFITTKVINWSYSDNAVRIKKTIGISYNSDVRLAQKLIIEAAESVKRVLKEETKCHLNNFGDNSIDLQVRFWICDPAHGINNVTSEVLLAIWDSFKEHGIEFPFPQRDVHLTSETPIRVKIETE